MTGEAGLDLEKHQKEVLDQVTQASDAGALDKLRIQVLGRKSALSQELSRVGRLPPDQRREVGRLANSAKRAIETAIAEREAELRASRAGSLDVAEAIDLTFPAPRPLRGHPHPVSLVMREMEEIFRGLGYDIARGPEIETDYYAFEALNIPRHSALSSPVRPTGATMTRPTSRSSTSSRACW